MAQRVSAAGLSVEQTSDTNYRRISGAGVGVEQRDATNYRRIANASVMVEWTNTEVTSMAPTAGVGIEKPTHHATLGDGSGTTLGLILCDPQGKNDMFAIRRSPYPTTGLKISQGDSSYKDKELPFANAHQDDWSGGRAALNLSDDTTRFADSFRAVTDFEGAVKNGAAETYATGLQKQVDNWTAGTRQILKLAETALLPDKYAVPFTAPSGGMTVGAVYFKALRHGAANTMTVYIYNDSTGVPGTSEGTVGTIRTEDTSADILRSFCLVPEATISLSSATTYWLVFSVSYAINTYWGIEAAATGTTGASKVGAAAWATGIAEIKNRIVGNTAYPDIKFYEYKGAMYAAITASSGAYSYMWINGDRGVADASAAATLVDATKTWGTTQYVGATVRLIRGTGSDQAKPYRKIASHTDTTLTLERAWDIVPDTTTEYVIVDTDVWNTVIAIGPSSATPSRCLDVAVAGEFVYFAFDNTYVLRYNWYNNGGTATGRAAYETVYAKKLLTTYDSSLRQYILWGAGDSDQYYGLTSVWKMRVPKLWGALYTKKGDLLTFDAPFDDLEITNVTQGKSLTEDDAISVTVAAGYTTGLLAGKYLTSAVDITEGTQLSFHVKSSVACDPADLKLYLSCGEIVNYDQDRTLNPDGLYHFSGSTFTDMAAARDADTSTNYALTFATGEYIYIIAAKLFNTIRVNIGSTVNANAATLTAEYMSSDGADWTSVTITDGTVTTGAPFAKTGNITFTMPSDWQQWTVNSKTGYVLRIKTSANLTASVDIGEVRLWGTAYSVDLPALAANTWTQCHLAITPLARPYPDDSAITSVGLYLGKDLGAQVVTLRKTIEITEPVAEYIAIQTSTKIRRMIAYGDERANPWIITEDRIYEIQTENDNAVVPIPLDELKQLASPMNGLAAATNDVYLYFNLDNLLERYYSGKLEDIGPSRDEGLPELRRGTIQSIVSYPGAVYIATNGLVPAIMVRKSSGWHEVYRAPIRLGYSSGTRYYNPAAIRDVYSQAIPGGSDINTSDPTAVATHNRLWIAAGSEILSIPMAITKGDDLQEYVYESDVITPWIDMGFLDVSKRFASLKLYTEDLSGTGSKYYIRVSYQLESGELEPLGGSDNWTVLSYASNTVNNEWYVTSPFETKYFDTTANAKRIRLRFQLFSENGAARPTLKAYMMEAILSMDVSYSYVLTVRLSDHATDLNNNPDETARAETTQAIIDNWASSPPTILTLRTNYSTYDNLTVFPLPMSMRPYKVRVGEGQAAYEAHIAEITLLDVRGTAKSTLTA